MDTRIIKINKKEIDKNLIKAGAKLIQDGKLVAFPTETVYGLGANGLDRQAVESIYKAKGRPSDNPLILHISSIDQIYPLVREVSQLAYEVIEKFWPGPLTLIFEKSHLLPDIITAGLDTVAIRMPNHPIAQELISEAGLPIAAPSANLSGKPSPTNAGHVIEDMMGKIPMIIDGGKTNIGLESTVLDLSGEGPLILRPGAITYEGLKDIIPNLSYDNHINNQNAAPKSPGQKYRHYAPEAEMILFTGQIEDIAEEINSRTRDLMNNNKKVGIMATKETKDRYNKGIVKVVGSRIHRETIASDLFRIIREFDKENVNIILAEGVEMDNIGRAIMNRMLKAAGGKVVNL